MDMIERLESTSFLGKEFLTWLWYQSESQSGLIDRGPGQDAVEVWFMDRITLSGAAQSSSRVVVRAEEPGASWEARTALRAGKKVEQACLRIVCNQREWVTTITGERLATSSNKIPAIMTREEDDQLFERFHLLDQLDEMIQSLYLDFLSLRLSSDDWAAEVDNMRAWVAEGSAPTIANG